MTEDLSGLTIKGYELTERIGAGGFGAVYTAEQPTVGRRVAVKIILPGYANQPDFIRRFESEARLIARLEHPYIVPLYDYWRDPSGAYLVMRWLRGGSLRDALHERPFTLATAAQILDQVASGLSLAHRNGVIHRDIKPSNILLDEEGNAYLSDFGIAQDLKRLGDGGRGEGLLGTLDYVSPEQAKNEKTGPQSDIYSLGVSLYELLTGRHPYPGHSSVEQLFKHINGPLPEIEELGEGVNEVLRRATAKNPAQRYGDALEMAASFRHAARLDQDVDSVSVVETLTPREQQILALIVEGKTNRQIAKELYVEPSTVKWYISQIYGKLGVRSRVQAIVRGRELRLVVPGPEKVEQAAKSTSVGIALPEPANPYKGLKAFEAADSRDFFGREILIQRLIADLEGDQGRFLAVIGPSGSGKSSLVKAGLIPAIWRGALPGSERWFVVEMAPGTRPLDELEVALTRVAANRTERLREQLQRDVNGLLRVAGLILPNDGSEMILIIDQFEELFTLVDAEEERLFFLDLLQRAVSDPRSRVRVVITLRADFYHRPLQYPDFAELVRGQMETVLPLSAVELERAILRPAEGAGARFEQGLAPTIIEDVRYQPGGLPLMQYALTELFDRREGQLLTGSAYEAMGGIAGALAGRAESLYQELDAGGQEATRQLFLQLTTVEQSADDAHSAMGQVLPVTRRRVARSELRAVAADSELMDEIIDTFAAYRMLSLDHETATRRPTVEVAHEALLVSWQRLSSWLDESRDDLRQRRRLERLAGDWQDAGRDPSFLLSGMQLDLFVDWVAGTDLAQTAVEKDYLAANTAAREERRKKEEIRRQQELETAQQLAETERARAQAEQKRAEEQTRTSRRLRALVAGLVVLLLAAGGFALLAALQAQRADEQARLATTRELAALALSNVAVDPERSILLALAAADETYAVDGSILPEVEETLHRAIQSSRVKLSLPQSGGLDFSPDGARLATSGADGTITIWDPGSGEKLQTLSGHVKRVNDITFSPDGKMLASVSNDFERIVWDLESGQPILVLPPTEGLSALIVAPDIAFGPNSEMLLATAIGEETRIFEVASGREIISFTGLHHAQGGAFSPDGERVALGDTGIFAIPDDLQEAPEDSIIFLRDRLVIFEDVEASTGIERRIYNETPEIAYSPDGSRVAAASADRLARMWDAASGELLLTLDGHTGLVHGVAFSPDGRQLATGSADGTVKIWDVDSGEELLTLTGHQDEVMRVAFGADGQTVATSSLDGTTKLWDISKGGKRELFSLIAHEGESRVAIDPTGQRLASVGSDGTAQLWDAKSGEHHVTVIDARGPFSALAFSPDGRLLALGRQDASTSLVDAESGQLLDTIESRQEITSVALSPTKNLMAIGSRDGTVLFWNLESGEATIVRMMFGSVSDLDFSDDGKLLASAGSNQATVWEMAGLEEIQGNSLPVPDSAPGARLRDLHDHVDVVSSIRFSKNGSRIVTASWDGSAIVWNTDSGEPLQWLQGHVGRVIGADFSPDGNLIATAGSDGNVILWDANSGEKRIVLASWGEPLRDVAFSPDGKHLVTSDISGTIRAHVVPAKELLSLARERVTRTLTEEECQMFLHTSICPQKP